MPLSIQERFDLKYSETPNGCWLWSGMSDKDNYGVMKIKGRRTRAHRISYELHHQESPGQLCVLHRCDTPSCVNPEHLFLGTNAENTADKVRKGRQIRGKDHYKAKLSEKDVLNIREDPRSLRVIAREYGVYYTLISKIKNKQVWMHL